MTKYTEKDIQKGVISALKVHGWFVQRNQQGLGSTLDTLTRQGMKVLVAADVEIFCQELEKIEEQLWGERRIKRLL